MLNTVNLILILSCNYDDTDDGVWWHAKMWQNFRTQSMMASLAQWIISPVGQCWDPLVLTKSLKGIWRTSWDAYPDFSHRFNGFVMKHTLQWPYSDANATVMFRLTSKEISTPSLLALCRRIGQKCIATYLWLDRNPFPGVLLAIIASRCISNELQPILSAMWFVEIMSQSVSIRSWHISITSRSMRQVLTQTANQSCHHASWALI